MCIPPEEIISGLIATGIWTLLVIVFIYVRRQYFWSSLSGTYHVFKKFKGFESKDYEYSLEIKRKGNRLELNSVDLKEGDFIGEILLDETFRKSGKGYYQQKKVVEGITLQLWGYFDITIKAKGEILVHKYYITQKNEMDFQGFVWKKIKSRA